MSRIRSLLVGVVLGGSLYLLLIDTVSSPELYAGAGATLLAALAYEASYAQGFGDAAFRLRWFRRAWKVISDIPVHIALVCAEAVKQSLRPQREPRGLLRTVPFAAGEDNAHDLGRRALTEALGSFTPNTIVIGVDRERELLLVHQLHVSGPPEQLDRLGLGR